MSDKKKTKVEKKLHKLRKKDARIMKRSHKVEGKANEKIDKIKASNLTKEEKDKKIQKIYDKTNRKLDRVTRKTPKIMQQIRDLSTPLATTPNLKMKP